MPSTHTNDWLNYTFPQITTLTTQSSPGYTPAMAFQVSTAMYIDALAWYRPNTTLLKPTRLAIWSVATQTEIVAVTTITDDGSVGWQDVVLASPVPVYPGTRYKVAAFMPSGGGDTGCSVSSLPATANGLSWSPVVAGYKATGAYGYPNVEDTNSFIRGLDVRGLQTTPPAQSTLTNADVQNDLANYLSVSDADHTISLPAQTHDEVVGLHTKIDQDGITWDAKLGPLETYGTIGNKGISSGLEIVRANVADVRANLPSTSGLATTAQLNAAVAALSSALTVAQDQIALLQSLRGLPVFPTSPWTLIDETDFDQRIAWAVEAEIYVVTVTDAPAWMDLDIAGLHWRPRLGWWAVLTGTQVGQRRFFDFNENQLIDGGRRMPGVLVNSRPGFSFHIQAWQMQ